MLNRGDLPAGYKRLEYLESTGSQYIDTGIVPTSSTGLLLDNQLTSQDDTIPFGCRNSSSTDTRFYAGRAPRETLGGTYMGYGWGAWSMLGPGSSSERALTKLNWLQAGTVEAKGIKLNLSPLRFTPTQPLYLFAANVGGRAALLFRGRIWQAGVTEASKLVSRFMPALDPTGAPCMFDLVSRKPFYNAGTGDFIYPNMEMQATTYNLRRRDYAQMTEHGIRRLYHVPKGCNLTKEEYAEQNGFKLIVETPQPEEGYWLPVWHEREDCIELEWVETEPPMNEEENI